MFPIFWYSSDTKFPGLHLWLDFYLDSWNMLFVALSYTQYIVVERNEQETLTVPVLAKP